MECAVSGKYISNLTCIMQPVARNTFRMLLVTTLVRPVDNVWVKFDVNYRYSTYRSIIARFEDACEYFREKNIVRGAMLHVLSQNFGNYTNFNHTCPYEGDVILRSDRFSADNFRVVPLVPSGRYYLNVSFFEGGKKNWMGSAALYSTVSDHRVWFEQ